MRLTLIPALMVLLTACAGSQPNFLAMSEEELHAYNMERPLREQVYCYEQRHTRSWIPRRQCATVQYFLEANERAAAQLYTMSPTTGYSVFGRSLD